MRKLLLALLVVLVIVVVGAVALALRLNSFLDENRDWLAERAQQALGREVAFSDVEVSLRGGLGARIEGLQLADDPAFSSESFLDVGSASDFEACEARRVSTSRSRAARTTSRGSTAS